MTEKQQRKQAIRELVAARAIQNQNALRQLLRKRGWDVAQSTLSRDLRELGLARIPDENGSVRYTFPDSAEDEATAQLEKMLPSLLIGAEGVGALVVARTRRSAAQPVAEAVDLLAWPEVAGTIAGDDTVLVICRSTAGQARVVRRLEKYLIKA